MFYLESDTKIVTVGSNLTKTRGLLFNINLKEDQSNMIDKGNVALSVVFLALKGVSFFHTGGAVKIIWGKLIPKHGVKINQILLPNRAI